MKTLAALGIATLVCLTSCASADRRQDVGPLRDWNAHLNSPDAMDLDRMGADYHLFLYDIDTGDPSAIRLAFQILSSREAQLTALPDSYCYLAQHVYQLAYNDNMLDREFAALSPEQQRRLIQFIDSTDRSSHSYHFDDWMEVRETLSSGGRVNPDADRP